MTRAEIIKAVDVFMKGKQRAILDYYLDNAKDVSNVDYYNAQDKQNLYLYSDKQLLGAIRRLPMKRGAYDSIMCLHCQLHGCIHEGNIVKMKCSQCHYGKVHKRCNETTSSYDDITTIGGEEIRCMIPKKRWTEMVKTLKESVEENDENER